MHTVLTTCALLYKWFLTDSEEKPSPSHMFKVLHRHWPSLSLSSSPEGRVKAFVDPYPALGCSTTGFPLLRRRRRRRRRRRGTEPAPCSTHCQADSGAHETHVVSCWAQALSLVGVPAFCRQRLVSVGSSPLLLPEGPGEKREKKARQPSTVVV